MKVDVELEPFTPLLRPTYADAHAGAISEVRMEGYEFGHTCVCKGPACNTISARSAVLLRLLSMRDVERRTPKVPDSLDPELGLVQNAF